MRITAVVSLMCATLCGCEPAPDKPPEAPPATTAAPVAQSRFYPARLAWEQEDPAVTDSVLFTSARAIGIVYPAFAGNLPGELSVVNDTARELQTIARLRFYAAPDGGHVDTLWVRDRHLYAAGLERASHEDYGFAAVARHGSWARVVFAYDTAGTPRQGWVRIEPPRVVYADYDSLMLKLSTHFNDPAAARFYDRPNGRRLNLDLKPSHAVRVLGFQGDWIQVMIAVPDTSACTGDPDARIVRRDTAWVPRLNINKTRQIFAATAGC